MRHVTVSPDLQAVVDDADYDLVTAIPWSAVYCGRRGKPYALHTRWIPKSADGTRGHPKTVYMHRLILGVTDPNVLVDHINSDPLDNRRSNLRLATRSQNQMNRLPDKGRRFKGVYRSKGKWGARIKRDNVRQYLGTYGTEEEAARAYDAKARELHGEFAHLNFS